MCYFFSFHSLACILLFQKGLPLAFIPRTLPAIRVYKNHQIMSYNQSYKIKEHVEYIENKTKATPIAMVAPEVKPRAEVDMEITKTCAVLGCEDFKNMEDDSFFRFPEDSNLRQIWTDLTGRNNWTPTDYSYICIQHFSVDCFMCDSDNQVVLVDKAVPSLKLPGHVLEVEYIDEDTLDNEDEEMETDEEEQHKPIVNDKGHEKGDGKKIDGKNTYNDTETAKRPIDNKTNIQDPEENIELLKLFYEVQKMQREAISLRDKLKNGMKTQNKQKRVLRKMEEMIERKKGVLNAKRKKKSRILLSLQDKIEEDTNGLVLAMPVKHTEDFKNFALSIYKYSPQAYIYCRNTLRTLLPSTDVLDSWVSNGSHVKTLISNSNMIKVVAEQTDSELSCKIKIG